MSNRGRSKVSFATKLYTSLMSAIIFLTTFLAILSFSRLRNVDVATFEATIIIAMQSRDITLTVTRSADDTLTSPLKSIEVITGKTKPNGIKHRQQHNVIMPETMNSPFLRDLKNE